MAGRVVQTVTFGDFPGVLLGVAALFVCAVFFTIVRRTVSRAWRMRHAARFQNVAYMGGTFTWGFTGVVLMTAAVDGEGVEFRLKGLSFPGEYMRYRLESVVGVHLISWGQGRQASGVKWLRDVDGYADLGRTPERQGIRNWVVLTRVDAEGKEEKDVFMFWCGGLLGGAIDAAAEVASANASRFCALLRARVCGRGPMGDCAEDDSEPPQEEGDE